MKKKRKKIIPPELLAVRIANRQLERELLGDGFHSRTRLKRNRKIYTRKQKHAGNSDL
ncbi:MAG: hypothetical protein IJQ89_09240 [Bacteroidales bacterium]|nr:hypothetical protein [Bacteroidales bacterium]